MVWFGLSFEFVKWFDFDTLKPNQTKLLPIVLVVTPLFVKETVDTYNDDMLIWSQYVKIGLIMDNQHVFYSICTLSLYFPTSIKRFLCIPDHSVKY